MVIGKGVLIKLQLGVEGWVFLVFMFFWEGMIQFQLVSQEKDLEVEELNLFNILR